MVSRVSLAFYCLSSPESLSYCLFMRKINVRFGNVTVLSTFITCLINNKTEKRINNLIFEFVILHSKLLLSKFSSSLEVVTQLMQNIINCQIASLLMANYLITISCILCSKDWPLCLNFYGWSLICLIQSTLKSLYNF